MGRRVGRLGRDSKRSYIASQRIALGEMVTAQRALHAPSLPACPVAVNCLYAHESLIEATSQAGLLLAVDRLAAMGVPWIDVNMGLFPWTSADATTIAKYDAVIDRIRNTHGLPVHIGTLYTGQYHTATTLAEWTTASHPIWEDICDRYDPERFNLLREPSSQADRMGFSATVNEWVTYIEGALALCAAAAPATSFYCAVLPTELAHGTAFADIAGVDAITYHIYDDANWSALAVHMAAMRALGKAIWIDETWRPFFFYANQFTDLTAAAFLYTADKDFEYVDRLWLEAVHAWARNQGCLAVTPFWMGQLFAYGPQGTRSWSAADLAATAAAITADARSQVGDLVAALNGEDS